MPNLRFTCESDIINTPNMPDNPCWEFQIRFYVTMDDGKYLLHSATMKTCYETKSGESADCEGPFKGDEIVKDDRINGCIKNFLATEPGAYDMYQREKAKIMANNP